MKYRIERTSSGTHLSNYSVIFRIQCKRWWWPVWTYVKVSLRAHPGCDPSAVVLEYKSLQDARLAVHFLKEKDLPVEKKVTYYDEEE